MANETPDCLDEYYIDSDGNTVKLLWDDVPYLDDDGDTIDMCVYVTEDHRVAITEKFVFDNEYSPEENTQNELDFD